MCEFEHEIEKQELQWKEKSLKCNVKEGMGSSPTRRISIYKYPQVRQISQNLFIPVIPLLFGFQIFQLWCIAATLNYNVYLQKGRSGINCGVYKSYFGDSVDGPPWWYE